MKLKFRLNIGTKSVLYGAHCFVLHPFFVAWAWYRLYGFPWDLRLWVAFFVHDLGYWGKPNMDGEEGERHPYFGANLMNFLFDNKIEKRNISNKEIKYKITAIILTKDLKWYNFTLYHSRFLAKKNNAHFSKLCVADKYAICLTPSWLYIPMASATGEIKEYMKDFEKSNYSSKGGIVEGKRSFNSKYEWHQAVKKYVASWVEEHKDMREDTWTPKERMPIKQDENNSSGVWK